MLYGKYIHIGFYGVYSISWTQYNTYLTLPFFYVHFKDIKIKTDKLDQVGSIMAPTLEYSSPKLPGMGDINLGKFVSALMDIRYECPAVIESEDMAFKNSQASRKKQLC